MRTSMLLLWVLSTGCGASRALVPVLKVQAALAMGARQRVPRDSGTKHMRLGVVLSWSARPREALRPRCAGDDCQRGWLASSGADQRGAP